MKDTTILVSLSGEQRAFIDHEIAFGHFSDEAAVLHAALEALMQETGWRTLTEQVVHESPGGQAGFNEPAVEAYLDLDPDVLRKHLSQSEASGVSDRDIPAILHSVKAKLRANGAL